MNDVSDNKSSINTYNTDKGNRKAIRSEIGGCDEADEAGILEAVKRRGHWPHFSGESLETTGRLEPGGVVLTLQRGGVGTETPGAEWARGRGPPGRDGRTWGCGFRQTPKSENCLKKWMK